VLLQHKHIDQFSDIKNNTDNQNINGGSNQSDSEIILSKIQRDLSRKSRQIYKKQKDLTTSKGSSNMLDEVKGRDDASSPIKLKPKVAPRVFKKPAVTMRKTSAQVISGNTEKEHISYQQDVLTPICNPDHSW